MNLDQISTTIVDIERKLSSKNHYYRNLLSQAQVSNGDQLQK